ncbi:hypothetical protein B0I27_101193 [Arcticibacter pallidicorallinus]|uniref:Short-subunit dehydrogenase n=1 Tax=Arcticibacter pallidicorallinus TaxID=1259464 RepID=A0A2T0UBA7_9SPHI|nr:SDR family oxidoreductase [Arcticibacter pallidicorallinus]PRY55225.1 hypothetical protein B0I27_101193 [Arcticibacter pallidicorallinus]
MENNQRHALITGATSGIGYELAKLFAKDKYNLVIVARDSSALERTASELRSEGIQVHTIAKDLFLKESAREIYDEVKSLRIHIDILVNDAGQGYYGKFEDTDLEKEIDIIQLNVISCITLTKLFLKDMLLMNDGRILNVGSIAGEAPGPYQSVYHGTKAFVNSWTAAIRNELKDTNITVTALLPGATDTDFFNKADMLDSKILDSKLSNPEDVAKDGYDALMSGDDKIVSGMKNKVQVAMANVLPDSVASETMGKQQEPKDKS